MNTRTKRSVGLIAMAAMAMLVLSACINVTYKLTVNSDATLSGTLQAQLSKQAMIPLGLTSTEQLKESLTSGDMELGVDDQFAESCQVGEDATYFIITCTAENLQVADVNDEWSLTKTGNELTFRIVNEGQGSTGEDDALMPDIDLGTFSFTAVFPGPISSVTGTGATQTGPNTVKAEGPLSETIDFTVVASAEASDTGSPIWVFIVLGIAVVVVIVIIALVLRPRKKKDEPAATVTETPPTADSSDPSI